MTVLRPRPADVPGLLDQLDLPQLHSRCPDIGLSVPITDHRSPITDHRSPITDYRSPRHLIRPLVPFDDVQFLIGVQIREDRLAAAGPSHLEAFDRRRCRQAEEQLPLVARHVAVAGDELRDLGLSPGGDGNGRPDGIAG